MGGANIELVALAQNDNEIMGNPEITFFKSVFRRHTNFVLESKVIRNSGDVLFGSKDTEFKVANFHDLLTNVYVEVVVSGTNSSSNQYTVNHFGNSLIKEAKLVIGGKTIETLYSQWLQIYHELSSTSTKNNPDFYHTSKSDTTGGGKNMTFEFVSDNTAVRTPLTLQNRINGNTPLVFGGNNHDGNTSAATKYFKKFFIPLPFYFTKNIGLSLPLCAIKDSEEVKIVFTLETAANLTGDVDTITLESFALYGDYILLENAERSRLNTSALTYLIETVQRVELTTPNTDEVNNSFETTEETFSLDGLRLSVKYLCWVVVNTGTAAGQGPCNFVSLCDNNENGNDGYYGKGSIILNGINKQDERCMSYYTRYLPQQYSTNNVPDLDRIGLYSFAISPFENQPSGTCNFSRLNSVEVKLKLANNTRSLIKNKPIHFYAVNYNIFNINNGLTGLKYT